MKARKKTKKAVTLLGKIETLLSDVLKGGSAIEESVEKNVRDLLLSAKSSIDAARDYIAALPSSQAPHKAKGKAKRPVAVKRVKAPAVKKRALKKAS
jgi:hypothetical protein